MNTLKKLLLAPLFLFCASLCLSHGATEDADAVYLEVKDIYTLGEDGALSHRHAHKVRLLTHCAFSRLLGESFLVYNPAFQELEIHECRTFMADGTAVDSTPNAFNEVLPGFCRQAPAFNGLREMVVTHLGLECGAVICFDYEIRSAPGFFPFLMGEEVFGGTSPIEKKTVVVRVPETKAVQSAVFNHAPLPSFQGKEDGYTTYTWIFKNLPLVPGEGMADDIADVAPRLVFSTCPSWLEAARPLKKRFDAAAVLDEALVEKVASLKKKEADPLSLMRAIHGFVVSDVAGVSIDPSLIGYAVRPAAATYRSSSGTADDKAALLLAMLRESGLTAEPVLVSQHRGFASGVPSWLQFRGCRVLCTLEAGCPGPFLLDPGKVGQTVHDEGLAGRTIFKPCSLGRQVVTLAPSCGQANKVKAKVDLVLDIKKGLTGTVRLDLSGALNPYFRLVDGLESAAAERMRKLVPGAEFQNLRALVLSAERSVITGTIKAPVPLAEKHGLIEYTLPGCPGGVMEMGIPLASRHERRTPLRLPRAVTEELDLTLTLPDSVVVASMPEAMEVTGLPGEAAAALTLDGNVLRVKRSLTLDTLVAPDDFGMVRRMLIEWSAPDALRLVLKPAK